MHHALVRTILTNVCGSTLAARVLKGHQTNFNTDVKGKKETGDSPVSKTSQDAFAMSDMITLSLPYFSLINNNET